MNTNAYGQHRRFWPVLLLIGCFAFGEMVILSGCATERSPVSGRKRAYGYTWQQEVQLGRESDQQIVQQFGLYDDPQLQQYVNRIGQDMLTKSHLRRSDTPSQYQSTECTFRVLSSRIVNAFALPGCYIYVTRGLLNHLNNEAQLAVVLGHEIGHVAARHASQQAFESQLGQIGLIGGAILGQEILGGQAGQAIMDMGGQAFQLMFLKYGRDDERESDQLGVEYAALGGYKAEEGAEFFNSLKRLGEQQGGGIPSFLSTHPDPGEREQSIHRMAEEWESRTAMEEVNQDAYYQQIENLILGVNPREGFVENNVFYHPDLAFQFPVPANWIVQNENQYVAVVEPNQQAYVLLEIAQGVNSAQEAVSALANQEGIRVVESGARRVNGLDAYALVAEAQTQQGTLGLLAYAIELGGQVYRLTGVTSAQTFNQHQSGFQRVMEGFSRLTDRNILNRQPARLRIVTASRSGPFSSFVPRQLPLGMTAEELAILNQVELDETIQTGRKLKLPSTG